MMDSPRPDIVVGIDIGQTCSGIAYSIGPDWSEPRTLNRWPSRHGFEKADKVATRVGYSAANYNLDNWGFESVFGDDGVIVREQFKLTLDPDYQDDRGFSCSDARKWYYDYLTCLHREIAKFFHASVPNWRDLHVEYSFSTPTTWKNPAMIASVEKLIRSAGFAGKGELMGQHSGLQTVRMALTEAEAAAIEASTTQYCVGDVFLICDAGGGTTDVNIMEVMATEPQIQLKPLDHVEGVAVGSTLIDFHMSEYISRRLSLIEDYIDGDIRLLAEEMLVGQFQTTKHSFPFPSVPHFLLDVKGLAGSHNFPEASIVNSRMTIDRATLKDMFDIQLREVFRLMDDRITAHEAGFGNQQISYIILSGGLGSSPYFYDELKRRYEMNVGFRSTNTSSIRIMRVLEPQLAVVRGLVRERTQQLGVDVSSGRQVFATRRCRNSYGVVVRVPYDETKHEGLPFVKSRYDKTQWVENMIDWIIKEGEEINVADGVRRLYNTTIGVNDHQNPHHAQIVMCSLPVEKLPRFATDKNCKHVVSVSYHLTENDMKLKNRQFWKLKRKYWKANFYFVVKIGPADLRFEIVGKNGVLSSEHSSLKVEFIDPLGRKDSGRESSKMTVEPGLMPMLEED